MAFEIWPYLVLIEGPAKQIGLLLLDVYDNPAIERGRWMVDHTMRSRRTYAEHLKRGGMASRRQGIGVKDPSMVRALQEACARLGLECHVFSKPR